VGQTYLNMPGRQMITPFSSMMVDYKPLQYLKLNFISGCPRVQEGASGHLQGSVTHCDNLADGRFLRVQTLFPDERSYYTW
jgi:hypothetical protein